MIHLYRLGIGFVVLVILLSLEELRKDNYQSALVVYYVWFIMIMYTVGTGVLVLIQN